MTKNNYYVLDTSALLFDPFCLTYFSNNYVVITTSVIEELDKHKERIDEVGNNARSINRALYKFKEQGDLTTGVKDKKSGTTIMLLPEDLDDIPESLDRGKADNRILGVCFGLLRNKKIKLNQIHLVTNDLNFALKSEMYGIDSIEFKPAEKYQLTGYVGYREIIDGDLDISNLYELGKIDTPSLLNAIENEYFIFKNSSTKQSIRCVNRNNQLIKLDNIKYKCYGIKPLNNEQAFAMDLLLNPDIKLVTLTGTAGTGKTLLSVAAGLYQSLEKNKTYERLIISRSLVLLSGRDKLGFLKGTIRDKLDPYLLPLKDAVDQVMGESNNVFEYLTASLTDDRVNKSKPKIEIEPLIYIRGRSLRNAFFVIDESQNLTTSEIKTILSRAGENCKIVLLGDVTQVDNCYLNKESNGLAQTVEKFKGSKIAGHIYLREGLRSPLATEVANRL